MLATLGDGLTVGGVPPYWATVSTGALMIFALVVDKLLTRTISDRLVAVGGISAHAKAGKAS